MRNTSEQLDIRQLLFCLITLANVIWDSKDFHPFECTCSLMLPPPLLPPPTRPPHSLRSILFENSGTWQLLHPHLPPLGHSRNYIWQMRQGAEAMAEWADGEGYGCVQWEEPLSTLQAPWSHVLLQRGWTGEPVRVVIKAHKPEWSSNTPLRRLMV